MSGELKLQIKERVEAELRENLSHLTGEEAAVLAMLEARLEREVEPAKAPEAKAPKTKAAGRGRKAAAQLAGHHDG